MQKYIFDNCIFSGNLFIGNKFWLKLFFLKFAIFLFISKANVIWQMIQMLLKHMLMYILRMYNINIISKHQTELLKYNFLFITLFKINKESKNYINNKTKLCYWLFYLRLTYTLGHFRYLACGSCVNWKFLVICNSINSQSFSQTFFFLFFFPSMQGFKK